MRRAPKQALEWLLGGPGQQLTEEEVPTLLGGGKAVSGERYYRWRADPKGWMQGDFLLVSIEAGVVKETWFSEMPLF